MWAREQYEPHSDGRHSPVGRRGSPTGCDKGCRNAPEETLRGSRDAQVTALPPRSAAPVVAQVSSAATGARADPTELTLTPPGQRCSLAWLPTTYSLLLNTQ